MRSDIDQLHLRSRTYVADIIDDESEELGNGEIIWRGRKLVVRSGVAVLPQPRRGAVHEGAVQGSRRSG